MIETFSDYIKSIAICIIFIAFIQMLLPNNNFRKYIDVVLGFIIILLVLNPISKVLFEDHLMAFKIFSIESNIKNASLVDQKDIYEDNQKGVILQTYKEQINEQLMQLVSQNTDLAIENIAVEIDEDYDSKTFASIKGITLYANNINAVEDIKDVIYIEQVEKVSVQNKSRPYEQEEGDRDYEVEKKLESLISDFYKLDKDNIYIIVHST